MDDYLLGSAILMGVDDDEVAGGGGGHHGGGHHGGGGGGGGGGFGRFGGPWGWGWDRGVDIDEVVVEPTMVCVKRDEHGNCTSYLPVEVAGAGYQGTAADYQTNPIGPLSPQQLADLDRALKPDEQAAMSAGQAAEADSQAAVEHARPLAAGEHKVTVDIEPARPAPMKLPTFMSVGTPKPTVQQGGMPNWVIALILAGAFTGAAIAGGVYLSRRKA